MYDGFVRVPGGHMRALYTAVTGNVTLRCAVHRRLLLLSTRTGTLPFTSLISSVSSPAGDSPGGPPGTCTTNDAFVTPALRTIRSRISAYCASAAPLRTGRTVISIEAPLSTTVGTAPRWATAALAIAITNTSPEEHSREARHNRGRMPIVVNVRSGLRRVGISASVS
ncbi:MAG: hypothetical protein ACO1Q7_12395 [Gemmatimonas sp.]